MILQFVYPYVINTQFIANIFALDQGLAKDGPFTNQNQSTTWHSMAFNNFKWREKKNQKISGT